MSKPVTTRLDDQLYAQLLCIAKRRNMKPAAIARDLIRRGLGMVTNEGDAGFQEGIYRGMRAVHQKIQELRDEDFEP